MIKRLLLEVKSSQEFPTPKPNEVRQEFKELTPSTKSRFDVAERNK